MEEDVAREFLEMVPLSKIAARLSMSQVQFYMWVKGKFPVRRIKNNVAAVTKETAKAIMAEARVQGLENAYIPEKPAQSSPDHSEEPTSLAYRIQHPRAWAEWPKHMVKAKTSRELGQEHGEMRMIDFSGD